MLVLVEAEYYIDVENDEDSSEDITEEEAQDRATEIFLSNPGCYDSLIVTVIGGQE